METSDLNEVLIFTRVVDAQGFTAAAKALSLPKSTVSRKVGQLEQRLGVQLLVRTTRKLNLTEGGRAFYERCARIVAELDEAEREVRDMRATPKGTLRISAPLDFTLMHFGELIDLYQRTYPEVALALTLTSRRVDLVAEGIDLALRGGVLPDSSLVARKLADDSLALFASPAYLKEQGTPRTLAEIAEPRHRCIVYGREPRTVWKLTQGQRTQEIKVNGRLCADDMAFLVRATLAGRGIALLPALNCNEEVRSGRLVRLLPDHRVAGAAFYAVYPSARHLSSAARAFLDLTIDWIARRISPPAPPPRRKRKGDGPA